MAQWIGLAACLTLLGAAVYLFYVQHFQWRSCFNEMGRCLDAETGVVYTKQSGVAWLSLVGLALALTAAQVWRIVKHRR